MTYLPFVGRRALGQTALLESGFRPPAPSASMATVWLPLAVAAAGRPDVYWTQLLATQEFYGHPAPASADLGDALQVFAAAARRSDPPGAVCVTVSLDAEGTILVSGAVADDPPPTAVLRRIEPDDDVLSPRSDWQMHAMVTNARAQIDAYRRLLNGAGTHDAVVVDPGGNVQPLLGAVLVVADDALHAASPTTMVPPMVDALLDSAALRLRDNRSLSRGLSETVLNSAQSAWWMSPEFVPHRLTEVAGFTMPARRAFDEYFVQS